MTTVDPGSCSSSSNGQTGFICIYCGKVFNDSIKLKIHQKYHNGMSTEMRPHDDSEEEKNICEQDCGEKTSSVICVECGDHFRDNLLLQIHHRTTHKLLQPSNTVNNGKRQKKNQVKKEVMKTHKCTVCSQCFEKRSYLLLHMRLHTGERPYKCSVCSKEFRLIGHITTHMTTHLKERPYECSVCHKKFARGDYMKKHMKTHTGEKPYVCSICEKAFTLKGNLERHMISHTKEKRHSCTTCGEKFSWEKTLERHVRRNHSHSKDADVVNHPPEFDVN